MVAEEEEILDMSLRPISRKKKKVKGDGYHIGLDSFSRHGDTLMHLCLMIFESHTRYCSFFFETPPQKSFLE